MMTGKTEDTQSFYLATSFQIGPIVTFTFFLYCIFSSLETLLLKKKLEHFRILWNIYSAIDLQLVIKKSYYFFFSIFAEFILFKWLLLSLIYSLLFN